MSEADVKNISGATGTFKVFKPATEPGSRGGKPEAETGNKLPEEPRPDLQKLAQKLNNASRSIGRDLRFEVDLENGRSVIQVLDRETGEIIRQIPPEHAETYISEIGDVALRLYDARV